jgi:hypothetical protein
MSSAVILTLLLAYACIICSQTYVHPTLPAALVPASVDFVVNFGLISYKYNDFVTVYVTDFCCEQKVQLITLACYISPESVRLPNCVHFIICCVF